MGLETAITENRRCPDGITAGKEVTKNKAMVKAFNQLAQMNKVEKGFLLDLVKRILVLYFSEILVIYLIRNHFHLLRKIYLKSRYTDEDIQKGIFAKIGADEL